MLPDLPPALFIAPALKDTRSEPPEDSTPRMAVITIHSSNDKERDVRRMRRIHGMLVACPGKDHFSFQLLENGHVYILEFPNETTRLSPEQVKKLIDLVGENNLRIDQIQLH